MIAITRGVLARWSACACGVVVALAGCHRSDPAGVHGPAGSLHVDDGGTGGIPIVFVHGFGGSSAQWADQLAYFRPTTRAVAIDLRGHGKSEAPKDHDYSVTAMARDLDAVVDELDLDRFVLVGHSMGGAVALEYARERPDRVAALVLVGTPGKSPPELARQILAQLRTDYDKTSEQYWDKLLDGARPSVAKQVRHDMRRISHDDGLAIIGSVFAYDPTPALRAYTGPVLLVDTPHGDGPGALHTLAPRLPRIVVTGTSHWPQLDKPGEVDGILEGFLAAVRRGDLRATPAM